MDHPLNTDLRPLRGQPPPAKPEKARPRAPCVSSSRDAPRKLLNKYFNISSQLDDYQNIEWENGDIINCHPILFTVIEDALTQNGIYENKQKAFISLKNNSLLNKFCMSKSI